VWKQYIDVEKICQEKNIKRKGEDLRFDNKGSIAKDATVNFRIDVSAADQTGNAFAGKGFGLFQNRSET
jgi:hypothetical protein